MALCFVCNRSPTWYIANGREYCESHREAAVEALKAKVRFSASSHRYNSQDSSTRPLKRDPIQQERLY